MAVPSLMNMDIKPNINQLDMGQAPATSDYFVRVRGLPFSATCDEIVQFFSDVNVEGGSSGITFTYTRDGRPSGEAYIAVASQEDQELALRHNRENMGSRYIEVFEANRDEMEYVARKMGPQPAAGQDGVLRLRGLPFGCSKEEIVQFFAGYEIVPNGITMTTDNHGRTAGDAYVQFVSQNVAERAIEDKNMKRIGHRYIELFRSTCMEARQAGFGGSSGAPPGRRPMRPAPYDRPDRYGGPRGGGGGYEPYSHRDRYGGGPGGGGGGMMGGPGSRFKDNYGMDRYGGGGGGGGMRSGGFGRGRGGGPGYSPGRGNGAPVNRGAPDPNFQSMTGHSVHMRGLPFSAAENDIARFFAPLAPIQIVLGLNNDGRKSGEADVDFETHDEACEAMKKDKSNMEHRYIELFLNSSSAGIQRGPAPRQQSLRSDFGGPPPENRFATGMSSGYGTSAGMDSYRTAAASPATGGGGAFGFNTMSHNTGGTYF